MAIISTLASCSDSCSNHSGPIEPPVEKEIISVDDSQAEFCDLLDGAKCLLPFPSNNFTSNSTDTDTGLQIHFDVRAMPVNSKGVSVDPKDWSRTTSNS